MPTVPRHIEVPESELTDTGIAGEETCISRNGFHYIFRDRLPGLVVAGEGAEEVRLSEPVFHDLGRKLDEVMDDVGAGEGRERHAGQKPVKSVTELMKHRTNLIKREERGLAARLRSKVHYERDDRAYAIVRLYEVRHPSSALLAFAGEKVREECTDEAAVFVPCDVPHRDIGVVRRECVILPYRYAVEVAGESEEGADGLPEGKVRAGGFFVVGEVFLAE